MAKQRSVKDRGVKEHDVKEHDVKEHDVKEHSIKESGVLAGGVVQDNVIALGSLTDSATNNLHFKFYDDWQAGEELSYQQLLSHHEPFCPRHVREPEPSDYKSAATKARRAGKGVVDKNVTHAASKQTLPASERELLDRELVGLYDQLGQVLANNSFFYAALEAMAQRFRLDVEDDTFTGLVTQGDWLREQQQELLDELDGLRQRLFSR